MINLKKERLDLSAPTSLEEIVAANPRITAASRWAMDRWTLDGRTPGYGAFTIGWHPSEASPRIVDELKLLAAHLFVGRGGEPQLKYTTGPLFSASARFLAQFMEAKSYGSLADLDARAFATFQEYLKKAGSQVSAGLADYPATVDVPDGEGDDGDTNGRGMEKRDEPAPALGSVDGEPLPDTADGPGGAGEDVEVDGPTRHFFMLRLSIWKWIQWAKPQMQVAGVKVGLDNVFQGKSLYKLATSLASRSLKEMEALPDEVVLPILTEAHRLIGEPADQVIQMLTDYMAIGPDSRRVRPQRMLVLTGRPLLIGGEDAPWYDLPPLEKLEPSVVMAQLVGLIRDACVTVLAAGIGWRISEACSLEIEPRTEFDALPSCVFTSQSYTRTSDHFWVRGLLSKNRPEPQPEDWLIGARLSGTGSEPMTVRAIRVLERLLHPWRSIASSPTLRTKLLVNMRGSGISFDPRNIVAVRGYQVRHGSRNFIVERAGLKEHLAPLVPGNPSLAAYAETGGAGIRPHQWRRTFFRMIYRTDPDLLPAISRHFKHVSLAVTEDGYAPRSPADLEEAEAVATSELVEVLFARGEGGEPPVTGGDRMLARHSAMLAAIIDGDTIADAAPRLVEFAIRRDIRLWPAEHGSCLIGLNPDKAACQTRGGRIDWRTNRPNLSTRSPGLCCSCPNLVLTRRDVPFWQRRHRQNQEAWLKSGKDPAFRAARDRARQARTILDHLGAGPGDTTKERDA